MATIVKIPKDVLISTPANCPPSLKNLINFLNIALNSGSWSIVNNIYIAVGNKIKIVEQIAGQDDETQQSQSGIFSVDYKTIYLFYSLRVFRSPSFIAGVDPSPLCWLTSNLTQQDIPLWGNLSSIKPSNNVLDVYGKIELKDVFCNGLTVNPSNSTVQIDYSGLKITLE
jgi:hypothetical protein